MSEKTIIDVTGTPLIPSDLGSECPGNGKHPEYECCCDECDYYLHCFPQFELQSNTNKKGAVSINEPDV